MARIFIAIRFDEGFKQGLITASKQKAEEEMGFKGCELEELSGLDRKEVDKAMKQLKEEGAIVSPVRCKWAPAE